MKIDTHSHIILSNEDVKGIITNYLKEQGYAVEKPADINFTVDEGDRYDCPTLRFCSVVCRKKENVGK